MGWDGRYIWWIRPYQFWTHQAINNAQYIKAFRQAETEVETKRDVIRKILPLSTANSTKMCSTKERVIPFQNLDDLTQDNIVKIQPDIYDGADSDELDKEVYSELRSFVKPLVAGKKLLVVVPNFFFWCIWGPKVRKKTM